MTALEPYFSKNRRLIISAMQQMRDLDPLRNEWVSPKQVENHITSIMGRNVAYCGVTMADMTRPEDSPNNHTSKTSLDQRVLERHKSGGLYRLPAGFLLNTSDGGRRRREHLLDRIQRDHILNGIELFKKGHPNAFKDSTKFDLLHEGKLYPPKAVMGLAGVSAFGEALAPDDFTGGADSKCFRIYSQLGFSIVPKPSEFLPTADAVLLESQIRDVRKAPVLPKPDGQENPEKVTVTVTVYKRSAQVIVHVLRRASGKCECCGGGAPFIDKDGEPFLEVHHVVGLAEDGPDTVENAVAICPNCHRECHLGKGKEAITERLQSYLRGMYPPILDTKE